MRDSHPQSCFGQLVRKLVLKFSHVRPFSMYSMFDGSKGPLTLSMDVISALAGRMLLDGSGEVP